MICEKCGAELQDPHQIFCPNCGIPLREEIENFDVMLKKLLASIPEIRAVAISSTEGLPIASALPQGVDETRMAAMTAALLSLAERSVIEMEKGKFDQLYIKGSDGYLLVIKISPNAVITVSTTREVRLGLIFLDLKRFVERIKSKGYDWKGDGSLPYPFIFKPPTPPGDLGLSGQAQLKQPIPEEDPWNKPYCKNCGSIISEGQTICHVCKKRII